MILHNPKVQYRLSDKNQNIFAETEIYLLARHAIYKYLKKLKIRKAYLPAYCAMGAYLPYTLLNIEVVFYNIDKDFNIIADNLEILSDDIFHYIHHFGLYNEDNIKFLEELKNKGVTVIDDRALTLPDKPYSNLFDAELYSLYKVSAVPAGGVLKENIQTGLSGLSAINNFPTETSRLEDLMNKYFRFHSSHFVRKLNSFNFRTAVKLLHRNIDFSKESHINPEILQVTTNELKKLIRSYDFSRTNSEIIKNVKFLFENIDERRLLVRNKEYYCSQSLIGFPLKTSNREEFHKYLMKKGILGFSLSKGWLSGNEPIEMNIINNYYCLPCSAGLTEKELIKIVEAVNNG